MTPTEARDRDARHLLDLADKHEAQRARVGQLAIMRNLTGRDLEALAFAHRRLREAEQNAAWDQPLGVRVFAVAGIVVTCARDGRCEVVYDRARQGVTT